MIDTWPQPPGLAETPDIYHRRPVRLDWEGGCDAPDILERRREISEAYADFTNYGSRVARESLILGCAEMVRRIAFVILKRRKVHSKRYHSIGPDLYGTGLLAIVEATSDHTKFQPVDVTDGPIAYCAETGEICTAGDDDATVIRKYLRTVARRAMWDEFNRIPLVYVPPSTIRGASRRHSGPPRAPEQEDVGARALAHVEDHRWQTAFVSMEVNEVIRQACTEPLDAALVRLKQEQYTYAAMGQALGISPHQAKLAVNRIYESVCRALDMDPKPMGRGIRNSPKKSRRKSLDSAPLS